MTIKELLKLLQQEKFDRKGTALMVRWNDQTSPLKPGIELDPDTNQAFLTADCTQEDTNYE